MQESNGNRGIWRGQLERLGAFLVASAFLIAAFVQLVTTDNTSNSFLTEDIIKLMVHATAALGSFTSTIYFFMNIWEAKSSKEHVTHTWFIPLVFTGFWIFAWIVVNSWWWSILYVTVLSVLFLNYQCWGRRLLRWIRRKTGFLYIKIRIRYKKSKLGVKSCARLVRRLKSVKAWL